MKKYYLFAVAVFLTVLYVSCTTPTPPAPPQEPSVQPQPAVQVQNDGLDAAMERAEKARQRASDFESPAYFPGEWETAEDLYARAGQLPKSNNNDIQRAVEAYNAAADSFDAVFALTIPLYAQAKEDEIMAIRGELINAGLRDAFPEYFIPADEEAVSALEQYEAKDYYAAKDSAERAYGMYDFMKETYGVWQIRQDIVEKGLDKFCPDEFDSADGFLSKAMEAYLAKEDMEALLNANEASQRYNNILKDGMIPYRDQQYSLAVAERQAAIDVRANIAVTEMFANAENVFNEAKRGMETEDYEETAREFFYARNLYAQAGAAASEKRRIAAEAIREAEEVIDEVIQNARQAESNTRGGTR
jgi:hypothetical protein